MWNTGCPDCNLPEALQCFHFQLRLILMQLLEISELSWATRSLMIKQHMRGKIICIYISLKQELLSKDKVITLSNQPFKLKYIRTLFTCFGLFQWHRRTKLKLWTIKHLTATAVIFQPLLSTKLKRYTIFRDINQPSKGE